MLNAYFYIRTGSGILFAVHSDGNDFFCECLSAKLRGMQIHIRRYSRGEYKWLLDGTFSPVAIKALFPSWDLRLIRSAPPYTLVMRPYIPERGVHDNG